MPLIGRWVALLACAVVYSINESVNSLVLPFREKVSAVSLLAVVIRFNGGVTVVGQSECLAENAAFGQSTTDALATRYATRRTYSSSRLRPSSFLLLHLVGECHIFGQWSLAFFCLSLVGVGSDHDHVLSGLIVAFSLLGDSCGLGVA